jgi:DNA-binding CsgD family transcriptional regulator
MGGALPIFLSLSRRLHSAAVVGSWPLVGRREELELVAALLRDGPSSGVVVAGDAGVGKTRFLAEVLAAAEARRYATGWSTATRAAATIPFGAFAHLLPIPEPSGGGRLDLLRRAGGSLRERAGERRLVLAVDDAHLLDDSSAALVHQLASTATAFVVVSVRTGDPMRDPIVALWKDGLAEYVELEPLSEREVTRLLELALAGDVDGATALALWQVTRGNALFLHELVAEGLDRGTLVTEGRVWRWKGSIEPGARVAEIVRVRIGELAAAELAALELVAFGEPIGVSLLERLIPEHELESLERRDLLSLERSGRRLDARLAHPLYGEVLRSRVPARRALAARLASALEATGSRRREDLLRLAVWRLEGGVTGAPELLVAAARRAIAAFDPTLAERLATAAVDRGGGFPARYALSVAVQTQARFDDADALLAQLSGDVEDDAERAQVADARAATLFWGLGRATEAKSVLLEAEATLGDRDLRDELAAIRSAVLVFSGRPAATLAAARPILARRDATERARARAGLAAVTALCMTGGADEAHELVGTLRDPALRLGEELPFLPSQLFAAYSLALTLAGRLHQAHHEAHLGYERALSERDHQAGALWAMMLGRNWLDRGALGKACSLLREGAALYADADLAGFRPLCLAYLSRACAQTSGPDEAERALAQAQAALRPGFCMFDADLGLARAWTFAAAGDLPAAREEALRTADVAEANGQLAFAALALHELARLDDPTATTDRLDALAERLDGPLIHAYAAHAHALAGRDADALERTGARFEAIGAKLLAAEAFAEASAAHRARRHAARGARSATKATVLTEGCEMPATPALANVGDSPSLTRRERDIASLAASGLSNRAIADRLVVSVRTVEHHLEHAYQKLGVSRRSQLARHLGAPTARD